MNAREMTDVERRTEVLVNRIRRKGGAQSQRAFDELVALHDQQLRGIAGNFLRMGSDVEADEVYQLALIALWHAVQRDRPGCGLFLHFASKSIRSELIDDFRHRRAKRRWAGRGNVASLDTGGPDGEAMELLAPSWTFGGDPLHVLLYRDSLQRAWESLTDLRRDTINEWLASDGRDLDDATTQNAAAARRHALAIINADDGMHPNCSSRRRCGECGEFLPPNLSPKAVYCPDPCVDVVKNRRMREARALAA